ncbi:U3 small nucleolar ribonucleoprotein protein [Heterostelium album PN500]|uniref:U3 small nucleolar ribonucleoprotein protein n=1 Tax=Heterostelium pallidum (strain ATCC 26659 / Pp 5 / PN500) TaxID=670386 RepID=D3BFX3_HETP5|nr:U3 small nucleolar ribonucleoprotein protein [Heterostelium album PN500]EFA79733.1 U3 small nucleolar ribonucleoprotein protein [Heterostelium album PN500]|eukprot:XP_020431854.1 U3 small nucleolar ribonucleoprotein protein [Heterostelium album PN500]
MVRPLKYHEQKLLKKHNFVHYRKENVKDVENINRFGLTGKEEYAAYTKLVGSIQKILHLVQELDDKDPMKKQITDTLCEKLYDMGVIDSKTTFSLTKICQASFCRRRINVLLVQLKYAQNLANAASIVQHGHIRIGPEVITDPALIVTRKFQDLLTWVDNSSMRKKVLQYNNEYDDYELLQ